MGLIKYINNTKISTKLSALAVAVIFTFLIVASISMMIIIKSVLGQYINDEVKIKSEILKQNIELMEQKSLAATEWFSTSARLISAFKSGDREAAVETGRLAMKSITKKFQLQ